MAHRTNYTMLFDFYELSMANGYFQTPLKDRITYFDVFFRRVPDGGGFAIAAGLEQAIEYIQNNKVLFAPAKAANAGGVAVSALEMAQNSMRYSWTFEEVDNKLKTIMADIYENSKRCAKEYGHEGNLLVGCNIAGFLKVADAMLAQGVC